MHRPQFTIRTMIAVVVMGVCAGMARTVPFAVVGGLLWILALILVPLGIVYLCRKVIDRPHPRHQCLTVFASVVLIATLAVSVPIGIMFVGMMLVTIFKAVTQNYKINHIFAI